MRWRIFPIAAPRADDSFLLDLSFEGGRPSAILALERRSHSIFCIAAAPEKKIAANAPNAQSAFLTIEAFPDREKCFSIPWIASK
ncbi:MAG: hypothetical protein C3F11_10870 [Methylocystaceae bacterium]|nr:MAG: hypothetical protein C3F11_10870 [Methylocystaceae bacterium]